MVILKFFFRAWLSLLVISLVSTILGAAFDYDLFWEIGKYSISIFLVILLAFVFCVIWTVAL